MTGVLLGMAIAYSVGIFTGYTIGKREEKERNYEDEAWTASE